MAVESVLQRWSAQCYASDIRCYLGVSSGGSLNIGLSEHGRTGYSVARPVQASRSCCVRWCSALRYVTRPNASA